MADSTPRWITDTGRAVRSASNAAQAQAELKALGDALRELKQVAGELGEIARAHLLGRGTWWPGAAVPDQLMDRIESAEGEVERRELVPAVKELKQFTTRTRNAIHASWQAHVDSRTAEAAELRELVGLLVGNSRLGSAARDLQRALDSLPQLRSGLPMESSVHDLATTVALAEAFGSALPRAVRDFILAAASGGASITQLVDEVVTWLSDNGATDNFTVIAGRPRGTARG